MAKPVALTTAEFTSTVVDSDVPVVVDFWAPWCGPCRAIAPILDDLATEYDGRVTITKVNVDEEPELAGQFKVEAIPTLIVFKKGEVFERVLGAKPKGELRKSFEKALA
jgi:thioredoxin 1